MRTALGYILLCLFSFAYSYETIQYCLKAYDLSSIVLTDDFQHSEQNQESEESHDEKVDLSDGVCLTGDLMFIHSPNDDLHSNQDINFSTGDHSQVIYSPPEQE